MFAICPTCGLKVPEQVKACPRCGAALPVEGQAAPPPLPATPPADIDLAPANDPPPAARRVAPLISEEDRVRIEAAQARSMRQRERPLLSEEDRARIEAEERFRVQARARAEADLPSNAIPPVAAAPQQRSGSPSGAHRPIPRLVHRPAGGGMGVGRVILCCLLPPLAVMDKGCGTTLMVGMLTLAGWVPGALAAFFVCYKEPRAPGQRFKAPPNRFKRRSGR